MAIEAVSNMIEKLKHLVTLLIDSKLKGNLGMYVCTLNKLRMEERKALPMSLNND